MSEIWSLSAAEQAQGIASKSFSASEAVASSIARMQAKNTSVNAVVNDLSESALKTAKALDAKQASGAPLSPLHGVPITVKCNVDVEGLPNYNGLPGLLNNIAPADSAVVNNLRKAGAVIIGITNTPEFSLRFFTDNPVNGRTLNPWDSTITCGGSSGGAGAAVAMGFGAIAHGNDLAGSLRWPAQCNGVATIKATQGRIPAFNPSAKVERPPLTALMSTQGPLARTIGDVRLGLAAMAQRDARDPWHVPAPLSGPDVEKKVALIDVPEIYAPHPAALKAVEDAATALKEAGYTIERVKGPDIARPLALWLRMLCAEMATMTPHMGDLAAERTKQYIAEHMVLGQNMSAGEYMANMAERTALIRAWSVFAEDYPVILTPLSMRPTLGVSDDFDGVFSPTSLFANFPYQTGMNILTLPGVAVPVGLHEGRPIAVQLISQRFREDVALAAAEAIEQRLGTLSKTLWQKVS